LSNLVAAQIDAFASSERSRVLQFAPLSFDAAVSEIFVTLASGGTLVLVAQDDMAPGEPLARRLQSERISLVTLPPSVLQTVPSDTPLPELETLVSAGEACPRELMERWSGGRRFLNAYGPSEVTVCATVGADGDAARPSIGRPIPGARLYVLDEDLRIQPVGLVGELCVGGLGLARGYLNRPDITAAAFVPDPFSDVPGARLYRTGDLGRWLSDGRLEFTGRRDQQVKLRGFRIEPGEVETMLRRQPGVRDAAVVVYDAERNPRLIAYVVPEQSPAAARDRYCLPNGMWIAHLNKGETDLMYQEIFVDETYLSNGITLEDGDIVFDVGANIGLFTLFAGASRSDLQIFAFEPVPAAFQALRENVSEHGIHARLFECGLSRAAGQASFTFYPLMSGMSGAYADPAEDQAMARAYLSNQGLFAPDQIDELVAGRFVSQSLQCSMKTLSQVIQDEAVERIDLLKIDVEKSEVDVLEGIAPADWKRIRQIVLETHATGGRLERVLELLSGNGFAVQMDQDARFSGTELFRISGIRNARARVERRGSAAGGFATGRAAPAAVERRELSVDDLRTGLRRKLPEYMIPSEFVSLDALPWTASGKLDRKSLPPPESRRVKTKPRPASAPNPVEEILCGIWDEALGRENTSPADNFFEAGGHSLVATRVITRVRDVFRVDVPLRVLFECPTVTDLARFIASQQGPAPLFGQPIDVTPRAGGVPLSFAQQRLWFMQELEAGASIYNCPFALLIEGPLKLAELERTVTEIVKRHEVLRTSFPSKEGSPVQTIEPATAVVLPFVDAEGADPGAIMAEEFARPFDLKKGPAMRAKLVRLAECRHLLLLSMHHIVSDGWSLGILLNEIVEFYDAFAGGRAPNASELRVQYAEFAAWQRSSMQGLALDEQLNYWRSALRGCPTKISLPFDRRRPSLPTHAGACLTMTLPDELAQSLRELSRRRGVTLFMTLLAGFGTLLYRLSGEDDFAIGIAVAGRGRVELERLIGFFLNMLVLRTDLSGNPTFVEVLARLRDSVLGAFAHQDVPFEKLVEDIQPDRSQGAPPLFQVAFGLDRPPQPSVRAGQVEMTLLEAEVTTARYDLTLWISDRQDRLEAAWTFSKDLFDAGTIERMHRQFEALLAGAVAQPQTRVDSLELRSAEEAERQAAEHQDREASQHRRLLGAVPKTVTAGANSLD
jgi:FkbM family methyltransferase